MNIQDILRLMIRQGASDLHLKAETSPYLRIDGRLTKSDIPPIDPETLAAIIEQILPAHLREDIARKSEVDFAFTLPGVGRFRVNAFFQSGRQGLVIRRIVTKVPTLDKLNLPPILNKLAEEPRGLVLVTGTACSGKSTTLAAMIDHINSTKSAHIVTVEDPIEVIHQDNLSLINQREVGIDTCSYADALRNVVRQDPDVILIGEMRDQETVQAALTAAEMGTLVLSTLHTIDASETVNRIIDFFPPEHQAQIKLMLVATLRGIVSLRLLPSLKGGLVPAVEVLVNTATIKELVIENRISGIKEALEQGEYYGMQSFEQSLAGLYKDGKISLDDAAGMASNSHDFKLRLRQLGIDASTEGQAPTEASLVG